MGALGSKIVECYQEEEVEDLELNLEEISGGCDADLEDLVGGGIRWRDKLVSPINDRRFPDVEASINVFATTPTGRTMLKFQIFPDYFRGLFYVCNFLMLLFAIWLTLTFGDIDWEDNPLYNTFGVNPPCIYYDYAPTTYFVPTLWGICIHIWLSYEWFRWARVRLFYDEGGCSTFEYKAFVYACFIESGFILFYGTVFAHKPDDDVKWHTAPFSLSALAIVSNVWTNFWFLMKVVKVSAGLRSAIIVYCALIGIFAVIRIFAEFACMYEWSFGCYNSDNGAFPFEVGMPWFWLTLPVEIWLCIVAGGKTGHLNIALEYVPSPNASLGQGQVFGWDSPRLFWLYLIFLIVINAMIPPSRLSCMDSDYVDYIDSPWIGIRVVIYFGTIAITAMATYVYWSSGVPFCCCNCCNPCGCITQCTSKDDSTELTIEKGDIYLRGFTLTQDANILGVTEQFLMFPFFLVSCMMHCSLTLSRLGERTNDTHGATDMTLCTLGLILFAHFVRNYLKMMRDAKKPLKKQRQKELLVTVYVIWSVVISLCRLVAALTPGGFTKHYLGRRC